MKAQKILFAAAALVACAACTRNVEQIEPEGGRMTYRAYQEGANETKTMVLDGGTQVYWEAADEIKVFFKSFTGRFVSQNSEPADVADFSGMLSILVGANEGAASSNQTWGLYPYRSDATYDGEYVTTTLPAAQTGRAGSFARNTHISLARSGGYDLAFYNVTGGVRFSLTHDGVNEVVFEGQNGEDIAGKVKLVFADGVPVVQEVIEGQKSITLTAPSGGTFQTGQWYYIVALPETLSNGFKMTFNTETQYATLMSSGSKTIKRGIFGSLADADEGLIYKDKGVGPTPEDVIQFEDPIAKYACVEKFDTNGDGEVSYAEAAAATTLSGLFTEWYTVTRFDEIKYFTGVTSTEGVFTGLTKLESITIPDNITKLGTFQGCTSLKTVILPAALGSIPNYCFQNCSSLSGLDLPSGLKTIGNYAFQNCAALASQDFPSTLTSIGLYAFSGCSGIKSVTLGEGVSIDSGAFSGCSSLVSVILPSDLNKIPNYCFQNCVALALPDFPSTLTSIGLYAFSGCSGIKSVTLGEGVSIGSSAFSGCTSLVSVILPSDLNTIPDYCFQNCTALSSVIWPNSLSSIGNYAFEGCCFKGNNYTLQLPSTVTSIGSKAFISLDHLIIPSTSFVSIASDSFGQYSLIFLYVPSVMVELYKSRTNWSKYASLIRPIEDYPVSVSVDLGLSVKWASYNVGAYKPEDNGAYFAWGETKPKSDYSLSTYKYCKGSGTTLTKYCYDSSCGYNGFTDNKTVLDLEDDAARTNWGDSWRMPTASEWTELREQCIWSWTTQNGRNGYLVTSKTNGNSIFLPAAGARSNTFLYNDGSRGEYWSSTLYTDYPTNAWYVYFDSSDVYRSGRSRFFGQSIRPVLAN